MVDQSKTPASKAASQADIGTSLGEKIGSVHGGNQVDAAEKMSVNPDVLDAKGRVYSTGKRKTAVARVWLKPKGHGAFYVNGRPAGDVFPGARFASILYRAFRVSHRMEQYDVMCTARGGGVSAQVQAVCHGVSVALQKYEPGLRSVLKPLGLLTRDARRVERKKPGLRKARRKTQFSKR
jgi:small subunit ribosomal protein S9